MYLSGYWYRADILCNGHHPAAPEEPLRLRHGLVKDRPGLSFRKRNIPKDRFEMHFTRKMDAGAAIGFRAVRQPGFHAAAFERGRSTDCITRSKGERSSNAQPRGPSF